MQIQPNKVQNRPRQLEFNRLLQKVENFDDFLKLDNQEKLIERILTVKKPTNSKIMIPDNFTIIQDKNQLNCNKKINYDCYKRLSKNQNLPIEDYYECNSQDLEFISNFNNKFDLKLNPEIYSKIINIFESNSTKFNVDDPSVKHLVKEYIDQQIYQKIDEIYDYWKIQKDSIKRFLIRKFSHPQTDDQNACLAFRPREKDKMKLRRNNRANDVENLQKFQQVKKELETSFYIIKCIQLRENYKHLLKIIDKYSQLYLYIDDNEESIQQDSIIEQFQKLKVNFNKVNKDIKNLIQSKIPYQEEPKPEIIKSTGPIIQEPEKQPIIEEYKKEEKTPSLNILQFKLRKLMIGGRYYLDRYQEFNDDQDFPKEFYSSYYKNKNLFNLQKKMQIFDYLYDSSDDDHIDSTKLIKKIQKDFKNFQKNRRNNIMIFD